MTYLEAFELIGEMFYRDTGLIRPGKSYPLDMPRPIDLDDQFNKWCELNNNHVVAVYSFVKRDENEPGT